LAEGGEVVAPFQRLGGELHRRDVEAVLDPPDERLGKRGAARGDLVEINARLRVVPGVEAIAGARGGQDVDVVRQQVVELARELQRIDGLVRAQMRYLRRRVHAGVGTPGAAHVDLAQDLRRRADEMTLDGFRRVTLRLPA